MSSKHKKTNVINRTTSETLRLGEVLPLTSLPPVSRKKIQNSSSSFQITAVTRTDGDDSADDLDTDDISRVTDNETPSFSEDSRDTDDHQLEPGNVVEPMQVDVKPKPDERFKIVKMPSTLPLSRGRWICVDYFDDATEKGPEHTSRSTSHLHEAYFATKPAGTMKGFPQGFPSPILVTGGGDPTSFPDQEMSQPKAANNQPSNGQKDDILSDIKVALTSMPATNSGLQIESEGEA